MQGSKFRFAASALMAAALLASFVSTASASAISYALSFSENLDVLKNPGNATLAQNQAYRSQHTMALQRTTPYFELRNTSAEAEITQFNISIGDLSKNYDFGKMIEASPGVSYSLAVGDELLNGVGTDNLLINFTGLGPGEFVRFRVGLATDDPLGRLIQDYREVLFQSHGSGPDNNATAQVSFANSGGQTGQLSQQLSHFNFSALSQTVPLASNGCIVDPIQSYLVIGDGFLDPLTDPEDPTDPGEGPQVPEPASVVLLAVGLAGVCWRQRKRFVR